MLKAPAGPTRELGRGEDKSDYVALEGRNLQDVRLWGSVAAGDICLLEQSSRNLLR